MKKSAAATKTTTQTIAPTAAEMAALPADTKPQTAREVIAANVQLLIEQLEAGHSAALTAYLTAMGRFHSYSLSNILEIARQRPGATRVAGIYAWNQLGRKVKKGERGIRILAPMIGSRRKTEAEAEKDIRTQNKPVIVGFRSVYVFDVAQTEGAELPGLSSQVNGDAGLYRDRLMAFIQSQGIAIEFQPNIAPALGMSYGGRIAILPGQGSAEEFSTLVHELAHEMLHKAERRTATTKTIRETEAEAIAFVVSQAIGLDAGHASADYIHLYHGNAELLAESLAVVRKTAALLLAAIERDAATDRAQQTAPDQEPSWLKLADRERNERARPAARHLLTAPSGAHGCARKNRRETLAGSSRTLFRHYAGPSLARSAAGTPGSDSLCPPPLRFYNIPQPHKWHCRK